MPAIDFSQFLDDDFDVKQWVNAAFKASTDISSKDQCATTLVMKLQMFIEEVNNMLEESCQQAIGNLPRVCRELEAVRQEATLLQQQMQMVKHDIEKVEQDTSQSMQMLLKLDCIKSRMKDAAQALQEADNWTTLSADVDDVFESGDATAIADKLVGMQQSLQILTDVPDFAERCQYLDTLKNRLEAMLSPQVVATFTSLSIEAAQTYVKIFTDIDRLPQLFKYYNKCQKNSLLQKWRSILESGDKDNFVEHLSELYEQLLSTWHSQITWCSQMFDKPVPLVAELLTDTLSTLDPSLPACIARHIHGHTNPLLELTNLKQVTERFVKNIESALSSLPGDHMQLNCINKFAFVVYSPYKPYIQKFGSFEEETLNTALNNIPLDHQDILDCIRLLSESVAKLFAAAKEANTRCIEFTNGCGYPSMLAALRVFFNAYAHEVRRVVTNLSEKCDVDTTNMFSVNSDDWAMFQNAMRIIQTCGELIVQTDELDQVLVSSIVSTIGKFSPSSPTRDRSDTKSPFHDYKSLLLDSAEDQRALQTLIQELEEDDMPSVLQEVRNTMCGLTEHVHKFAFHIVFSPLLQQMSPLQSMNIWTSQSSGGAMTSDLPDFSLSPQEYITKIGQYLMTLPQQLEPFSTETSPSLAVAVKHGKLPYTSQQELNEPLADLWLESLATSTMHHYAEHILKIPELTPHATKQLLADIDYLCNVLDDLGVPPSETMKHISTLLQTPQDEYEDACDNMPQRLGNAIALMRDLNLD